MESPFLMQVHPKTGPFRKYPKWDCHFHFDKRNGEESQGRAGKRKNERGKWKWVSDFRYSSRSEGSQLHLQLLQPSVPWHSCEAEQSLAPDRCLTDAQQRTPDRDVLHPLRRGHRGRRQLVSVCRHCGRDLPMDRPSQTSGVVSQHSVETVKGEARPLAPPSQLADDFDGCGACTSCGFIFQMKFNKAVCPRCQIKMTREDAFFSCGSYPDSTPPENQPW